VFGWTASWVTEAIVHSEAGANGLNGEIPPKPVPIQRRFRRLPEALLLTAGYYAGKAPLLGDLLRRPR
jgi:hypothetical protein